MTTLPFVTVDVFTERRFGGNPLAVVTGADSLSAETMQKVAAEFNLSETTFVCSPVDPAHTASVRIFNRTAEMTFAGHPMVGTAFALAKDRTDLDVALFEVPAGLVRVEIERGPDGCPCDVAITAPQPLATGDTVAPDLVALMLQLDVSDIVVDSHPPIQASNGNAYLVVEVTEEALSRCEPDLAAFRRVLAAHPQFGHRLSVHAYVKHGRDVRARMFAPISGTWEDPATGSANAPLACLLLSLEPETSEATFVVRQGIEMGRPSLLRVVAQRDLTGIIAKISGTCVPVMKGTIHCA